MMGAEYAKDVPTERPRWVKPVEELADTIGQLRARRLELQAEVKRLQEEEAEMEEMLRTAVDTWFPRVEVTTSSVRF